MVDQIVKLVELVGPDNTLLILALFIVLSLVGPAALIVLNNKRSENARKERWQAFSERHQEELDRMQRKVEESFEREIKNLQENGQRILEELSQERVKTASIPILEKQIETLTKQVNELVAFKKLYEEEKSKRENAENIAKRLEADNQVLLKGQQDRDRQIEELKTLVNTLNERLHSIEKIQQEEINGAN